MDVCWCDGDVDLRLRYFAAPLDRPAALHALTRPAAGCVCELGVVAYERDAWVRHAPAGGDLDGYLRDQLHGTAERRPG